MFVLKWFKLIVQLQIFYKTCNRLSRWKMIYCMCVKYEYFCWPDGDFMWIVKHFWFFSLLFKVLYICMSLAPLIPSPCVFYKTVFCLRPASNIIWNTVRYHWRTAAKTRTHSGCRTGSMWHVKVHSQCLPYPWKASILRKYPLGCCTNHSPAFPSIPKPLSAIWHGARRGRDGCTSSVPGTYVQKHSFSSSLGASLPPDQCHVLCHGLHPGHFLFDGAQLCQDGSLVEEVMCLVTELPVGNTLCLVSERRTQSPEAEGLPGTEPRVDKLFSFPT